MRFDRLRRLFRPDLHPCVEANRRRFEKFDRTLPIEDYDFVSVDTELTGLNVRRDAIVSIGAVRIRNLRIVSGENFFSYVHPKRTLPKVSTLIHRITPDQIEHAPRLKDILPDFIDFCGNALLVGHFIGLDMSFLNRACKKILGGTMANPGVDTMKLAQAYHEQQRRSYYDKFDLGLAFHLKALVRQYNLPRFDEHDSLEDAFQAAYLFLYLVKHMRSEKVSTLKDFYMAGRSAYSLF